MNLLYFSKNNMGSNQSNTTECVFGTNRFAVFENNWFERGTSRLAFKGTWHGDNQEGGRCVVKVFVEECGEKVGNWDADARAALKAKTIADVFNKYFKGTKEIHFCIPEIVKMKDVAAFRLFGVFPIRGQVRDEEGTGNIEATKIVNTGDFVAVEEFIHGMYDKFNSNTGWINLSTKTEITEAFSHFSYHYSSGEILVCDLQGVEQDNRFYLTDPAVHAKEGPGYYGPTDLGIAGFHMFFENHICNMLCHGMLKFDSNIQIQRHLKIIRFRKTRNSSYVFDIGLRFLQYRQNNSKHLTTVLENS